jgi:hypothetical protein
MRQAHPPITNWASVPAAKDPKLFFTLLPSPIRTVTRSSRISLALSCACFQALARSWSQLLRVIYIVLRPRLVMPCSRPICQLLARRTLGADGEDYRANFVHAPFPKNQQAKRPLRVRGSAAASPRKSPDQEAI